jgi:hypothetical protein
MAWHGLALIEDDVIGAATFATNRFFVAALVMHSGCALFAVRVSCFVRGQFVCNGVLACRHRFIALLPLVRPAIHALLLCAETGSAPALPLMRERNRDATAFVTMRVGRD